MPMLMINCPETGQPISTGLELSPSELKASTFAGNSTYCPYCKNDHSWVKEDVLETDAVAAH